MHGVGFSLRQYRAGSEFVAVRDVELFGRSFKTGERVPWREMGVHEVRMHELWRSNIVDCSLAPLASIEATEQKPKPVQPKRR